MLFWVRLTGHCSKERITHSPQTIELIIFKLRCQFKNWPKLAKNDQKLAKILPATTISVSALLFLESML
jgi:hypothetical protein